MKTMSLLITAFILVFSVKSVNAQTDAPHADPLSVEMARRISKELLGPNSGPFMQPLVTTSNAAANSRFFRTAHVPKKVDKAYFRFGLHSMFGFVRDDQKSYSPIAPRMSINEVIADTSVAVYNINIFDPSKSNVVIKDTAGMVVNILKYLLNNGLGKDSATSGISFPDRTATIFGNSNGSLKLNRKYFNDQLTKDDSLLSFLFNSNALSKSVKDSLLNAISRFPENFSLPTGGNINTVFAAIPQLEIGSLYGTELLLRFIPPIKMDKNVGNFAFWGIGLKHSISQYFDKPGFDAAVQVVYQGTHLENTVGVTNAELVSDATIFDMNLQVSKSYKDIIDVFGGFSYETISIASSYTYLLPVETQMQLGLLRPQPAGTLPYPEPEYPGDQSPQTAYYDLSDTNMKLIFGVAKQVGPVSFILDYSISKFNILSFGMDVTF